MYIFKSETQLRELKQEGVTYPLQIVYLCDTDRVELHTRRGGLATTLYPDEQLVGHTKTFFLLRSNDFILPPNMLIQKARTSGIHLNLIIAMNVLAQETGNALFTWTNWKEAYREQQLPANSSLVREASFKQTGGRPNLGSGARYFQRKFSP